MQTPRSSSPVRIIAIVAAVLGVVAVLALAYIWFSGGDGQASTAITAPTLAPATAAATAEAAATTEAVSTAEAVATVEVTEAAPAAATAEATAAAGASAEDAPAAVTYSIVPEESQVSFTLDEDLRGQRVTVVGTTNQVAGQVRVDFANPAASQLGTIRINVRTLATDNEFRDRAIRGQILRSQQDEFEFAQFAPTEITGLPDSVSMNEPITFTVVGDFTLRDVTLPVTFEVTVTPVSETRLEGRGTATIERTPFGLVIPQVPSVANVTEEVGLAIDFVAVAEGAGA